MGLLNLKSIITSLWKPIFYMYKLSNSWFLILTVCESGMFGKHCNKSCGKCLKDEQCHHVNGSCLNGCNPGYHGVNCANGTSI